MTIHTQPTLPGLESLLWGKRCPVCGERKSLGEYYRQASSKDGRQSRCKVCVAAESRAYRESHTDEIAAHDRAYREANWDKIAAQSRTYRETHTEEIAAKDRAYRQTPRGRAVGQAHDMRRRACTSGEDLTAAMIQEIQVASNGICPYCGDPFEDGHIDHVIPVSKGGTNDRENLVYCCAPRNLSKSDNLLEDWLC